MNPYNDRYEELESKIRLITTLKMSRKASAMKRWSDFRVSKSRMNARLSLLESTFRFDAAFGVRARRVNTLVQSVSTTAKDIPSEYAFTCDWAIVPQASQVNPYCKRILKYVNG